MTNMMKSWLSWRGLTWSRMNWHSRVLEIAECRRYYKENPPVLCRLKLKHRR